MKGIDFDAIDREIQAGYINVQSHPSGRLRVLNYSQKAQYEWRWNEATMACRGLIVDQGNNLVARPFPKFFSYEQLDGNVPDEPFEVFEKLDGSLGILYWLDGVPAIATRGSFTSPQAVRATEMFRDRYQCAGWDPTKTYLFEIIYPENRIVVDYQGREELVLLAVIDTVTGREFPLPCFGAPTAKRYDGLNDFQQVLAEQHADREGFVVQFASGQRVKIKFDEYKRLHKLLTGFGPKHVWELLRARGSLEPLLERVPDEFYVWVKNVESSLRSEFARIENIARGQMKEFATRRQTAMYFKTCRYPSVMFAMLDGKDYRELIWKMVKPNGAAVFRSEDQLDKGVQTP